MAEHNTLTGAQLHEPKGVESALVRTVYTADGLGSGSWSEPTPSVIYIEQESDFPTQDASTITLEEGVTYWLAAAITTAKRFVFETNCTLTGGSQSNSAVLTYTGTGTMFTGTDTDFTLRGLRYSHPNGTGFNVSDTTGGVVFGLLDQCLCLDGNSIGTFDDLGALVVNRCSFTCDDGLTTTGTSFGILSVTRTGFVTSTAGAICVDIGSSVFTTVLEFDNNFFIGPASGYGISGVASSANLPVGKLATISGCEFITLTPAQNILTNDLRWVWSNNAGAEDTMEDALVSLSGNATETVISTAGVHVKAAGTWVCEREAKFTCDTTGRITYDGERDITLPIDIVATVEAASGTNKDIEIALAKNGTVVANSVKTNRVSAADPKNTTVLWQDQLSENDYLEVFVSNETDTTNLIVKDAILRVR